MTCRYEGNVYASRDFSYIPFIHEVLKLRAEYPGKLWWRLNKEAKASLQGTKGYTKRTLSYNGHTHLINNVIKQLKYSHRGSAVRSIGCVEGEKRLNN